MHSQQRRRQVERPKGEEKYGLILTDMSPLFQAVIETTEETIYNSLGMAEAMTGYKRRRIHALPLDVFSG